MTNNLEMNQQDKTEVIQKILSLTDDQIWALLEKSEIGIVDSFDEVITEIRENEENSINLDMLLDETSKQSILDLIAEIKNPKQN